MTVKKKGELTTTEAAKLLGVSGYTTRRWAQRILDGDDVRPRGAPDVRLTTARRDVGGFYYLRKAELAGAID